MDGTWSRKHARLTTETATAAQDNPPQPQRSTPSLELNPYLAGEVIGDRYRLVRELSRGGMGVVWVAHSLVLGVDVALKLIRTGVTEPAVAGRMAREAHAAARLGHPALVRVFDFGWTGRGDPFLVMELMQGETLSAVLQREVRIPPIRAVQMLLPIADGLRLAHDKKIVHRDIKPDNIFLASETPGRLQPKLLDFGIAKVGHAAPESRLTQVGAVLGSPEYMSPEQALGADEVDERTDVWSLSVVLYEMVTGAVPFHKPNYNAQLEAIIQDTPTPMHECGAGDVALWRLVDRGLAKQRDERWANMTELGEALALWLYEHGIKEDLSGNSVRAVWLDGSLSGLRAIPSLSGRPGTAAAPPRAAAFSATTAQSPAAAVASPARSLKRPSALALVLGTLVGGFGAAAVLSSSPELQTLLPSSPASARAVPAAATGLPKTSATSSDPRAHGLAVSATSVTSAAPHASAAPAGTASATGVAIRATPSQITAPAESGLDATAARSTSKATSTKRSPAAQTPPARTAKRRHDFGF